MLCVGCCIFLSSTGTDQKQLKMGDKTLAFVGKCVDYASQNSNLVPSFIDVAEAKKDFDLASNLNELLQQLQPLCQTFDDTIMMAGSDSY